MSGWMSHPDTPPKQETKMGTPAKSNKTKVPKQRGGPKPDTLLGYVLDYLNEHKEPTEGDITDVAPPVLTPDSTINNLIDCLRDDIVTDALARR